MRIGCGFFAAASSGGCCCCRCATAPPPAASLRASPPPAAPRCTGSAGSFRSRCWRLPVFAGRSQPPSSRGSRVCVLRFLAVAASDMAVVVYTEEAKDSVPPAAALIGER